MDFSLTKSEPLSQGIKRIATEQIDKAVRQLRTVPEGSDAAVHDARIRFKKIRAILRLVRFEIGEEIYKQENIYYRDAGRRLSSLRDSTVLVKTLDDLVQHFADELSKDPFVDVRQALVKQRESCKQRLLDQENTIVEVANSIQDARERVANWPIKQDKYPVVFAGLRRVYKHGQKGLAKSYTEPEAEKFHEWRKGVKYLWYHIRFFRPLWPSLLDVMADDLHELANYLGNDHDLAVLHCNVLNQTDWFESRQEKEVLLGLISQRRVMLEDQARLLGQRVYAEKPKLFTQRMSRYWDVFQQ